MNATVDEWITYISGWTGADRNVIHDVASRILTAYSRARILAFILQTSFIARTFGIENTFGTTSFIRITGVFGQAFTFTVITYGVRTTRK